MDRALIVGNWKMNKTNHESIQLARDLVTSPVSLNVQLAICPPFTALSEVALILSGSSVLLGAQNLYWERSGAFTGEISGEMLRSVSCDYVLVGHSERRWVLGEDDETVARKTRAAIDAGLIPILCVGEVLAEREGGTTESAIDRQLAPVFKELVTAAPAAIVLAYEPVWAIGTGKNATPQQAQDTHAFIRGRLRQQWGDAGSGLPILYGGSVTPENCVSITDGADVDGVLVGGASLKSDSFRAIARNVGG